MDTETATELASLAQARDEATTRATNATRALRLAVIQAAKRDPDFEEMELARVARVHRSTVREWLGKPKRSRKR